MKPETFTKAVELDGRIRNVSAAYERLLNVPAASSGAPYKLEMFGLPNEDRETITKLILDYLEAEQKKAQLAFDAL